MRELTLLHCRAYVFPVLVRRPAQLWQPHGRGSNRAPCGELQAKGTAGAAGRGGEGWVPERSLRAMHLASGKGAVSKVGWGQEH